MISNQMINGLITVRSQSKRLPSKCFLEFGDGNVIEHLISRAHFYGINPIITTSDHTLDDKIADVAIKHGIKCYRGSEDDKIKRWRDTCVKYNLESFVTIDGDDLFFDGELNKKSHDSLINDNFDMVMHPKILPYHGCIGYAIKANILEKACEQKTTFKTDNHWEFIQHVKSAKITCFESQSLTNNKIRLTLDYQEDYWLLRTVLRLLGPFAKGEEIIDLFKTNPDLHKINWFKSDEYLRRQGLL